MPLRTAGGHAAFPEVLSWVWTQAQPRDKPALEQALNWDIGCIA